MVAIDYFMKWVEAEALASITPVKIKEFMYNKIALDPGWDGSFKIAKVLTPGAYKLSHLNG